MAICKNPSCNKNTFGDPSGYCFTCRKKAKSTKPASEQTKPPPSVKEQPQKRPPPLPPKEGRVKPVLDKPASQPPKRKSRGTGKTVLVAKGKKSTPQGTGATGGSSRAQSPKPSPQKKKQPAVSERNTVDTQLPPIVYIQTRYAWLGYKRFGSTMKSYIPSLESAVQKKPGGDGFSFTYRVLQKNERTNPLPPLQSVKNVDLELTCFKYANGERKQLAKSKATTEDGESTDTDFSSFMELFCGDAGVLTPVAYKLFAVTDANYAHTVAAAVAHKAFSDHADSHPGKKKVIINFDQHEDCGITKKASETIRCNNWGGFCLRQGKGRFADPIADVYIAIGTETAADGKPDGKHVYRIPNKKAVEKTGDKGIDSIIGLIKDKDWKESLVFVTVDRDFFIGNGTPWGDGVYMPDVGRGHVQKTLSSLKGKGVTFVGFEVSGVPEVSGLETKTKAKRASEKGLGTDSDDFLDRLATDIAFFWKLFNEKLT